MRREALSVRWILPVEVSILEGDASESTGLAELVSTVSVERELCGYFG
jgi:hypothetical protein